MNESFLERFAKEQRVSAGDLRSGISNGEIVHPKVLELLREKMDRFLLDIEPMFNSDYNARFPLLDREGRRANRLIEFRIKTDDHIEKEKMADDLNISEADLDRYVYYYGFYDTLRRYNVADPDLRSDISRFLKSHETLS